MRSKYRNQRCFVRTNVDTLGIFGYFASLIGLPALLVTIVAAIIFSYFGYALYRSGSKKSALNLMFASLFYLAIALGAVYIDKLF
jgi:heme O synthase-like polyprenyltransferase